MLDIPVILSAAKNLRIAAFLSIFAVGAAQAQRANSDSAIFARARQLVVSGNGAAGRMLVDSVVASTDPALPRYADALYWRAALAATSDDAERDYRRIVVEYPLSAKAGDALFQLAQLEVARGDRAAAAMHLERFLFENPKHPDHDRANLLLVRVAFEENDAVHGCAALERALANVPDTVVELRNQLQYYSPRCVGVDTTASPVAPASHPAPPRGAGIRDSSAAHAVKGRYTLQVAAYKSRPDAELLVKKLVSRGLDARVAATKTLYRVRIGRYQTRSAAAAAAEQLKIKKIDTIVIEAEADDR